MTIETLKKTNKNNLDNLKPIKDLDEIKDLDTNNYASKKFLEEYDRSGKLNREYLADLFDIEFKTESLENRKKKIRIKVDRKLMGLFGGKRLFNYYDFKNTFSGNEYSLDDIENILSDKGIYTSTEEFVKENFIVGKKLGVEIEPASYYFKKKVNAKGKEVYQLQYSHIPTIFQVFFGGDDGF